ncbi:MAG: 50S ribosomal protein L4 [Deltaproteobacteria bacterium RBG_16_50_11]|nr:MAG: 50S ribosomal protein L4 [Deltaproteobacteria bacterium RBG_16_50_11]
MSKVAVHNIENKKVGDLKLDDQVFQAEVHPSLLYEAVHMILDSRRKGSAATKNRALVRGGGAKPWRQKGTGRARAGTRRSPLWRGGGTTFGPMPRDYAFAIPKKERKAALRGALSMKQKEGKLILLDDFPLKEFKTREVSEGLKKLQVKDALIVTDAKRVYLERSARNIPKIQVVRYESLNVYDILKHEHLILLAPAAEKIQGVLVS